MTTTPDRRAALRAARTKDSEDKRRRVLAAVQAWESAGTPVTAAAVAATAGVSSWLVYAEGVREHLDAARRRQAERGTGPVPSAAPGNHAGSVALFDRGPCQGALEALLIRLRV